MTLGRRGVFDVSFDDGVGPVPALLVWMPGPRSFTAEDVLELHLPGQPELVQAALRRITDLGVDLAAPGEFTRRAFEHGRIDLTQAEGVGALVSAHSQAERRAAVALLSGGLSRRIETVRDALESVRALTEASLDFDEADTGHVPLATIEALAERARAGLDDALGWETQRTRDLGPARVVLAGAPNAGKSTLFNRLAAGEIVDVTGPALVSDLAGTTRDAKRGEWRLDAHGHTVELIDTAGRGDEMRAAASRPDAIAEERAGDLVDAADLVLWVVNGSAPGPAVPPAERQRTILVWNRADEAPGGLAVDPGGDPAGSGPGAAAIPAAFRDEARMAVTTSGVSGLGLDALASAARSALGIDGGIGGAPSAAAALGIRHRRALGAALDGVVQALDAARAGIPLDLVAEDLKAATNELDAIIGRTTPEDLLDRIFAAFCLGK